MLFEKIKLGPQCLYQRRKRQQDSFGFQRYKVKLIAKKYTQIYWARLLGDILTGCKAKHVEIPLVPCNKLRLTIIII